jgi:hypothetical protein
MPRVDLEKLKILSRFLGGPADLADGPGPAETTDPPGPAQFRPAADAAAAAGDDDPSERGERTLALIGLSELHAMLRERTCVREALEVLASEGTRTSAVHILPILVDGSDRERAAAIQALESIIARSGGTLGDPTLDARIKAVIDRAR